MKAEHGFELFYILAIPLFLFYQYLVASGQAPAVLGGYIGVVYTFILISLISVNFFLGKWFVGKVYFFIALFFVYLLFVILSGAISGANPVIISGSIAGCIYILVISNIFSSLPFLKEGFLYRNAIFSLIIFLFFLLNLDFDNFNLAFLGTGDFYFAYQFIAAAKVVMSIFLLVKFESIYVRGAVFLITSFILFVNGARTELFQYGLFYFVYESVLSYRTLSYYFYTMLTVFIMSYVIFEYSEIFLNNRVVYLLENGLSSGSGSERLQLFKSAWSVIGGSPVFGSYASYEPGGYVHSILTLWSDYGILPFLSFVTFYGYILIVSIKNLKSNTENFLKLKAWGVVVALLLSTIPVLAFAKTHEYLLLWVAVGLFINVQRGASDASLHNK